MRKKVIPVIVAFIFYLKIRIDIYMKRGDEMGGESTVPAAGSQVGRQAQNKRLSQSGVNLASTFAHLMNQTFHPFEADQLLRNFEADQLLRFLWSGILLF